MERLNNGKDRLFDGKSKRKNIIIRVVLSKMYWFIITVRIFLTDLGY